jgi:hypothetical protein
MVEMTYLTILRKLYQYTALSLADAGLSATSSLEASGLPLDYRAADEVAFRLTAATGILGRDWDEADAPTRRMLLHIAELPSGTLQYLQQSLPAKRQGGEHD